MTVAELSRSQIEEIEEAQPNRTQFFIGEISELLTSIATKIPTVAPTEINRQPVHLYVEPKQAQPVVNEDGKTYRSIQHISSLYRLGRESVTLSDYFTTPSH